MLSYASLCPSCGGCQSDQNHCPNTNLPSLLHFTITTQPSTHCLNGFGNALIGNGEGGWISSDQSSFGTMTACVCGSAGPGCCTNMGLDVGFFCDTGGPPYWRPSLAFGGCNFASITCDLNLSLNSTTVISCQPFHVQFAFTWNSVACTGATCTFNMDVTL
jgi:hypothetical protein